HAVRGGQPERVEQPCRVAGVEAAGHVGARDDAEHGAVVAEGPGAERFAEVGVEVDAGHRGGPSVQASGVAGSSAAAAVAALRSRMTGHASSTWRTVSSRLPPESITISAIARRCSSVA